MKGQAIRKILYNTVCVPQEKMRVSLVHAQKLVQCTFVEGKNIEMKGSYLVLLGQF